MATAHAFARISGVCFSRRSTRARARVRAKTHADSTALCVSTRLENLLCASTASTDASSCRSADNLRPASVGAAHAKHVKGSVHQLGALCADA
eukprot:6192928-Pleurochrysis_carterae.AAC.1